MARMSCARLAPSVEPADSTGAAAGADGVTGADDAAGYDVGIWRGHL